MSLNRKIGQSGSITIILLIVAVLAIGGAGAYIATDGFGTNEDQSNATTDTAETEQQSSVSSETVGSVAMLESALADGQAVRCTYEQEGNSGTAYISSEAEFRVDYRAAESTGHVITKDNTTYFWTDGESTGYMFEYDPQDSNDLMDEANSISPETLKNNFEEDNVSCEEFDFDDSLVELPEGIEFSSFEDLMQNIPTQN